jgi:hypothetical protein
VLVLGCGSMFVFACVADKVQRGDAKKHRQGQTWAYGPERYDGCHDTQVPSEEDRRPLGLVTLRKDKSANLMIEAPMRQAEQGYRRDQEDSLPPAIDGRRAQCPIAKRQDAGYT